ncbi:OmpA family protein [Primorskyibacter sp. S187A]|uniref:OmpA family protein n=1 Tax=Primorskyibacter sp. S187A TaxID=3415130 RepID=UPI003C7A303C
MMTFIRASIVALLLAAPALAQDMEGAKDHPMVTRFPGTDLTWQTVETFRPYRIPTGPVTGYRTIDEWIDTEGRVTRSFYRYLGADRDFTEVYLNFRQAFEAAGFEILAEGSSDDRSGRDVASRQWLDVYLRENPFTAPGEASTMAAGTSSSGGQGSFVATVDRAVGRAYVVTTVEQHAEDFIGVLIDIVELSTAEIGLVSVDAEAIGRDLAEKGRVVLDGIEFDFDSATLLDSSAEALMAVATHMQANPDQRFFVVGHTDGVGSFDYNRDLSEARAAAVVEYLERRHGISRDRLAAHGVGPLSPVFSNVSDAGQSRNRRVELVERLP